MLASHISHIRQSSHSQLSIQHGLEFSLRNFYKSPLLPRYVMYEYYINISESVRFGVMNWMKAYELLIESSWWWPGNINLWIVRHRIEMLWFIYSCWWYILHFHDSPGICVLDVADVWSEMKCLMNMILYT